MATPFPDQAALINAIIAAYNLSHSQMRVKVENTIGIIKVRFPVLRIGLPFRDLTKCGKCIQVLIAIHNLIIDGRNEDRSW